MSKKKVSLACDVCKNKNYRVPKSGTERLTLQKHCNKCRTHTLHKEEK